MSHLVQRINIASLKDKTPADDLNEQIQHLDQRAVGLQDQIQTIIDGRGGLSIV